MKMVAEGGILCRVAAARMPTNLGMFSAAGFERVNANHIPGFSGDCRDYSLSVAILHELGIQRVRLLPNHPATARALADAGIEVARGFRRDEHTPYSRPICARRRTGWTAH